MDPVFDNDIENDFEEQEIPIPEWMQVYGNEEDPLDISTVKTEGHHVSEELQCAKIIVEEEIHIEAFETKPEATVLDLVAGKKVGQLSSVYLSEGKPQLDFVANVKVEQPASFYQSDEEKPLFVISDLMLSIKQEQPSCSYAGEVKQEFETTPKDITEQHSMDLEVQSEECKHSYRSPAALLPPSDQLEGNEIRSREEELHGITEVNDSHTKHRLTSARKRIFSCNLCQYKTTYSVNLKKHMSTHTGNKIYICNIYQFQFAQPDTLKTHMLTHTGEKNFSCNICQSKFARFDTLKTHMVTHTGDKKFICNICQRKFTQACNLKTHMLIHTGEKKFSCNICQSKFAQSVQLKRHMSTHTGEKKFSCNICLSKFAQSGNLKTHMSTHTGEKKFSCNICQCKFALSSNLERHMVTHTY